jgi:uncharacterized repeat protein (TIGR01451 family)
MIHTFKQVALRLMGNKTHQLIYAAACLIVMMGFSSTAHAVLSQTITSTAQLNYASAPAVINASVDVYATIATANSATITVTVPATARLGTTSPVSVQIVNTGINNLLNGNVVITAPVGTTLTIPVDPYGLYVAVPHPTIPLAWLVTVPDLLVGQNFTFPASLVVPTTAPLGATTIPADYQANNAKLASHAAPVKIITTRTKAQITFMHLNTTTSQYTPAEVYHAGQNIYIQVKDGDQNLDPYTKQTVSVTLADSTSGDTETFVLTETGNNTGIFIGNIPSTRLLNATPNDGVLSVNIDSTITATYTDKFDNTDVAASAALVDPFGLVFDSSSGVPLDGATITIVNVATGLPATVFGDDGVSAFPATVVSGSTVTDASGATYTFGTGKYRFPFMPLGDYRLEITPPPGYNYPSQVATADIQALPTGPFSIVAGSRGETFKVQAGPALHIDVPLDGKGVNLFVRKTTTTTTAAIGDRVAYQISVENIHPTSASTASVVHDTLPLGFRYQAGSATLDGVALADPVISANGRDLSFSIGTIAAAPTAVTLSYAAVVGANTRLGIATNSAYATGTMLGSAVHSNTSKANVTIREDLIRSRGFIAGVVFIDENMNGIQDKGESGVEGIRIFMQDGRSIVTDKNGRYHFDAVKLGTHVVQMDRATIEQRYQAVGLKQTRFSKNDYSQFVEVNGGGLARANFRLINRAPEETPVLVKHALSEGEGEQKGLVLADVEVSQNGKVALSELQAFYNLPQGWKYVLGSATLNGKPVEPEQSPVGLMWKLDTQKDKQHIHLAMRGAGEGGLKQASTYVRFVSAGSKQGRTGLATINIQDTLKEQHDQRSFTLHLKFASRKAEVPEQELSKLKELIHSLNGLVVRELIVEGHSDNIPIAKRHQKEFKNNLVLSQARANYVAAYLKEHLQLDEGIVFAVGKGEQEPIASNKTRKGREQNRRVVLKVRADKITHDFSTHLQGTQAQGQGVALGSWDTVDDISVEAPKDKKTEGILSPVDGMSLPHPIASVRIALPSNLSIDLRIDGHPVPNERIGFKSENPKTGKTTYTYIGVDFGKQGEHTLSVKGMDSFGNARFEETIHVVRTGELASIKLIETGQNIADGKTPVRFRLALTDNTSTVIHGSIELAQLGGDLLVRQNQNTPLLTQEASQKVFVDADGWVTLAPVSTSGTHRIILGYNNVQKTIEVYVKPEMRDWILVGFGEGTVGYNNLSGAIQPITKPSEQDKFYKDGKLAFYAKGQIKGDFLLTLAYDTSKKTLTEKNSRFGDIDPNVMYTVYNDTTQQQFDGTSSKKLYVKIERDTFYALFGDYETGLSTTELTRYSRVFTGVKAEMHEDSIGFTAFATQTGQTMHRDEIQGNGTSGLYYLSHQNIISNTETVLIETIDRFKSEVILKSVKLTRHLDYDIDYVLGTIWFKQPVLSRDSAFNPIMIRVEYESDSGGTELTTAGGRVYVKPNENIEVGGTFVSEGTLAGSNTLSGLDVKVQVNDTVEVVSEVASSTNNNIASRAFKVEARLADEKMSGTVYARQQDDNFGLGQQLGSENATRKLGANGQYRLDEQASINGELFRQEVLNTGAVRDMASVQYQDKIDDYDVRTGLRATQDVDGTGLVTGSTLANVGATKKVSKRLSVHADHEQSLGSNNSVDFPSRSSLGAEYSITATTSLTATQEWTRGAAQDTSSTRLGVNTQPWNGATMSTSYEQQLSEAGMRSFANAGLLQTWELSEVLSLSASLDQTKVLSTTPPVQINLNAPAVTGGEDFTAISLGTDYHPGTWVWSNRLEYRTSNLSKHRAANLGIQGSPLDELSMQWTMLWQHDTLATGGYNLISDASLRAAWRPKFDKLILLNRFDVRRNEQSGNSLESKSLRYINNMTANWQTTASWQIRFNHGIKLSNETIQGDTWSGLTDLLGMYVIYDVSENWDVTMQAAALRVRHLHNYQPTAGFALGYNMFENFWLSMGYNFVGFYDQDFTAAEYTQAGTYIRFRFKYDQNNLADMLK